MKFLATYDGASAAELSEVKAAAVRGCIGAVKAPIVSFTEQVGASNKCVDIRRSFLVQPLVAAGGTLVCVSVCLFWRGQSVQKFGISSGAWLNQII